MAFFWSKENIETLIERVSDSSDWPEVSRHLPFTPSECKKKFEEMEAKTWEEKDDATLWKLRGLMDLCATNVAVKLCRPRHCVVDRFKILLSANEHRIKMTKRKPYTPFSKTELPWKLLIESLHIASRVGDMELLTTLINTGANVNATDADSKTALHIAASRGKLDICHYLIQNGADVNVSDKLGATPLIHAVISNEPEVVKLLVSADDSMINIKDEEGWTALHFAASNGYLEITKILKTHGATLEIADKAGYTPSQIAARRGKMDVFEYLVEN